MEHLFDEILEKDEKIIKIIKPHKGRYLLGYCWFFMIPLFLATSYTFDACNWFYGSVFFK